MIAILYDVLNNLRVLLNSNIGVLISNFLVLTRTFLKSPVAKNMKNPTF